MVIGQEPAYDACHFEEYCTYNKFPLSNSTPPNKYVLRSRQPNLHLPHTQNIMSYLPYLPWVHQDETVTRLDLTFWCVFGVYSGWLQFANFYAMRAVLETFFIRPILDKAGNKISCPWARILDKHASKQYHFYFLPGAAFGTARQAFWIRREISGERRNMLLQVAFTQHAKNTVCVQKSAPRISLSLKVNIFLPQIGIQCAICSDSFDAERIKPQRLPKAKLNKPLTSLIGF